MTLYQIDAPHYCAGLIVVDDLVVDSAPILSWARGKRWNDVRYYFEKKHFTVREIDVKKDAG